MYISGRLKVDASIYEVYNKSDKDIELFVLQIKQPLTNPIVLVSAYRPPQGNQTLCIDSIREVLQALADGNRLVLLGDLNMDYQNANLKGIKDLKQLEKEFSLRQQITLATRVTATTSSLIDHIYTNLNQEFINNAGVADQMISDHYATFVILKKPKLQYEKTTFTCRVLKNLKLSELEEQIEIADWSEFDSCNDVTKCWAHMYAIYIQVVDLLCPEKTYTNVRKRSEWVTADLFALMKRRDKLFKTAKE